MNKNKELYGAICYHVLTGRRDHAPSYLLEKLPMIQEGEDAFYRLDVFNMGYAIGYCVKWGIEVPELWTSIVEEQHKVAEEFGIMDDIKREQNNG
jgi:hypothetical protein